MRIVENAAGTFGNGAALARRTRLAVRRLAAWCVDWLFIAVFAALLIPIGLFIAARSDEIPATTGNLISFVLLVAPVTVLLALYESGRRAATPGKRLLGLRVRTADGGLASFRRALARNALKCALPWELGHTSAFTLASPTPSTTAELVGMVCGLLAIAIALVYLASLFIGSGRTPYDRIAGTRVERPQLPDERPAGTRIT